MLIAITMIIRGVVFVVFGFLLRKGVNAIPDVRTTIV